MNPKLSTTNGCIHALWPEEPEQTKLASQASWQRYLGATILSLSQTSHGLPLFDQKLFYWICLFNEQKWTTH